MRKALTLCLIVIMIFTANGAAFAEGENSMSYTKVNDDASLIYMAKTVWGEARGLSKYEKSMVCWCILNRVDSSRFPDSIISVIVQYKQFEGFREDNPVTEEDLAIATDVLMRYQLENQGMGEAGRTLPKEYCYFWGNGKENKFYKYSKGGPRIYYEKPGIEMSPYYITEKAKTETELPYKKGDEVLIPATVMECEDPYTVSVLIDPAIVGDYICLKVYTEGVIGVEDH